jgi:ABC-type transporter Mla subunit MlaD
MKLALGNERIASRERSKAFMAALGLFGIGVFLAFAWIGFNAPNAIPGRSYYYLYAEFKNADNITPHNEVRVDGDIVGQVLDPQVVHGLGIIKLQLSPSVAPLRSDTTVRVVPRSAIGVRYVEITPGLSGKPLASGSMIPFEQTSSTTPLDTVLSTLDPATRHDLQLFLRSFGEGLFARGQTLNDTLGTAPAFLQNTNDVLGTLAARPGATARLIHGAGTIAAAAAPVSVAIATGFQPESQALAPIAQSAPSVQAALAQAPLALHAVQAQLPAADALAAQITGFATAVRPGLAAGASAFGQTSDLLTEARPALIDARSVLATANTAVSPVLDLLSSVRPVLAPLQSGLLNAIPIVNRLGAHGCDFIRFGTQWTSMQALGNSAGNVLRFDLVTPGLASVYGAASPTPHTFSDPYPAPCVAGHETLP